MYGTFSLFRFREVCRKVQQFGSRICFFFHLRSTALTSTNKRAKRWFQAILIKAIQHVRYNIRMGKFWILGNWPLFSVRTEDSAKEADVVFTVRSVLTSCSNRSARKYGSQKKISRKRKITSSYILKLKAEIKKCSKKSNMVHNDVFTRGLFTLKNNFFKIF